MQDEKIFLPLQSQTKNDGVIAQLVEQRTENPCVPGSIPGDTTKKEASLMLLFFVGHRIGDPSIHPPAPSAGGVVLHLPYCTCPPFADSARRFSACLPPGIAYYWGYRPKPLRPFRLSVFLTSLRADRNTRPGRASDEAFLTHPPLKRVTFC